MMSTTAIPEISVIFIVITLLITLVGPLVGAIVLAKKHKGMLSAIVVGMLGFYIPQIVIRIPGLQLLSGLDGFVEFAESNVVLYLFFLAVTAALFDTAGRVLVFKFMKNKLSYNFGLGAGYGHGAIEAIYLVGLTYVNNLIIIILYNISGIEGLSTLLGEEAAYSTVNIFVETQSHLFLLAGIERVLVMVFHTAMSIIICLGFVKNKVMMSVIIVVVAHTVYDFSIVMLNYLGVSSLILELLMAIVAVALIFVIIKLKDRFDISQIPPEESQVALEEGY